jgi:hypothetical protein
MSAPILPPTVQMWKQWAIADAERRGLPGLSPILEGLAQATERLRATAWQPSPDGSPTAGLPDGGATSPDGR